MSNRYVVAFASALTLTAAGCVNLRDHGQDSGRYSELDETHVRHPVTENEAKRKPTSDRIQLNFPIEDVGKDKTGREVDLSSYSDGRKVKRSVRPSDYRTGIASDVPIANEKARYLVLEKIEGAEYLDVVFTNGRRQKQVRFKTSELDTEGNGWRIYLSDLGVGDVSDLRLGLETVAYLATVPESQPAPNPASASPAAVNPSEVPIPMQVPVSPSTPAEQPVGGSPRADVVPGNYTPDEARRAQFRAQIRAQRDRMVRILADGNKRAEAALQGYIQRDDERVVETVVDEVGKGVDILRERVDTINADVDEVFRTIEEQEAQREAAIRAQAKKFREEILGEEPAAEQPREEAK